MGAHMDISNAPRIWVKNGSGVKFRQIEPAWLARQKKLHAATLRFNAPRPETAREQREKEAAIHAVAIRKQERLAGEIITKIARAHHLGVGDLKGKERTMRVSMPRYHAIYEVRRQCPDLTHTQIAKLFGHDHHKIVLRAIAEWPNRARLFGIRCKPLEEKQ